MLEGRFKNFKKISGGYYPPDPQPPRFNFRGCRRDLGEKKWLENGGGGAKKCFSKLMYTPVHQNGRYQFVVTNLSLLQATKLSLPKSACRVNIIEIFILNVGGKSLPCIIVFEPLVSGRVGNTGQSLPVLDEGVIVAGIGLTAVYHHTDQVVVNSSEKNTEFKQFLQINQSGFRIRSLGFGFGSIVTV